MPDVFIPLVPANGGAAFAVVRLRPGVPLGDAAKAMREIGERLTPPVRTDLRSLEDELRAGGRRELWMLATVSVLVLLIAVGNVANLLLARAASRRGETEIRLSLGATRWQLTRGRLAEGVCVAVGGLVAGVLAARWCLDLAPNAADLLPSLRGAALLGEPQLDWRAFAFAAAVAGLAAMAFAAMPVGTRGRGRFALIAGQVALSFNLLFCGALLLRSLVNLVSTSPGFDPRGVVTAGIGLPEIRYNSEARMLGFHDSVIERLRALPGVGDVAAAIPVPMTTRMRTRHGPEMRESAEASVVSPGYFKLMRIPLLRGRDFDPRDRLGRPAVCIASESVPGAEVGRRIKASMTNGPSYPRGTEWEVVGIARDVRSSGLDQPAESHIYFPLGQVVTEGLVYLVRTGASPESMAGAVNAAVAAVDPSLQRIKPSSLDRLVEATWRDRRWVAALVAGFAATGLLLAAVGLYGLVAHRVARRTREIGVRMALGADSGATVRLVVGDALRPVLVGLVLGGALAVATSKLLATGLVGVGLADPVSAVAAAMALVVATLVASAHPAWRATRIAASEALRAE
jgi:cell division protein FtsX